MSGICSRHQHHDPDCDICCLSTTEMIEQAIKEFEPMAKTSNGLFILIGIVAIVAMLVLLFCSPSWC